MGAIDLLLSVLLYLVLVRVNLAWAPVQWRIPLFTLTNLLGIWYFFYTVPTPLKGFIILICYIFLVGAQFVILASFVNRGNDLFWIAFLMPLLVLVGIKYFPWIFAPASHLLGQRLMTGLPTYFIGLSYLAFRTSYLAIEVRRGTIKRPGFWEYMGFSFFVPTMSVGPINLYSEFQKGFGPVPDRTELPLGRSMLRVLVGWTKFMFLANLCNQLSYNGLLLDGHPHHKLDLVVAASFYYLYLYCNFSGFCDIAIGVAGLLGFPVQENFNNPLFARNMQDFWNRWHITLSRWFRDIVFTPLTKWLAGRFGVAHLNLLIAISIFSVFLLVGIWHGVGWNFVVYGVVNGLGLVVVHYYGIGLKKWLGKEGYSRYMKNMWVQSLAVMLTFFYISACLFFFANNFSTMSKIFSILY